MQIKPYEFMIKFTPHTRWAEGLGFLIVVAFFLGGIGGGLYLTSLYFNDVLGMFVGWLLAIIAGLMDMAHLHRPFRFWRMILRPGSSWIARGFILIVSFIILGAIQVALAFWLPGHTSEKLFKVLSGLSAFGGVIYSGFVLSYVKAVKLWNSAMIPLLFITSGLVGGIAIFTIISLVQGSSMITSLLYMLRITLVLYAITLVLQLWVSVYSSAPASESVIWMLKGNIAHIFWTLVIVAGIVVPLFLFFLSGPDKTLILIIGVVFVVLGNLVLRYVILKSGAYAPLAPSGGA